MIVHHRRRWRLVTLAMVLAAAWGIACITLWHHPLDARSVVARPTRTRIDVNTADAHTLTLLPGIGATSAQRIIDDRERHGPYRTAADLERVHRIGPSIRRGIEPYVSFGEGGLPKKSSGKPGSEPEAKTRMGHP